VTIVHSSLGRSHKTGLTVVTIITLYMFLKGIFFMNASKYNHQKQMNIYSNAKKWWDRHKGTQNPRPNVRQNFFFFANSVQEGQSSVYDTKNQYLYIDTGTGSLCQCISTGSLCKCISTDSLCQCISTGSPCQCISTGSLCQCISTGSLCTLL
jgi:hypothetical protein